MKTGIRLSRQTRITVPDPAEVRASDEDDIFEVNLRLQLSQVAESEAEELRKTARRDPTRKDLVRLACRIYDARRLRDRIVNRSMLGEPAWDMMLALYCLPARGERLTVTALTHAAVVTPTSGLRWQKKMTEEGLIERGPVEVDARKQMVRLTDSGRAMLETYLARLYRYDAPTPPYPERAGG